MKHFLFFTLFLSAILNTHANTQSLIRAANNGDSNAQCELGIYYFQNNDYDQAYEWLKKSADNGNISGLYNLGIYWDKQALDCEEGCREYFQKAFKCFYDAAQQDLTEAQYMLADYYYNGFTSKQNIDSARIWFERASDKGFEKAHLRLALITPGHNKRAVLFKKAYEAGVKEAIYYLALCYFYGEGLEKDINEGLRLLNIAADNGSDMALFELGRIYSSGNNVQKSKSIADSYFDRIPSLNRITIGTGTLPNNPISKETNITIQSYAMCQHPITIGLWRAVMGEATDKVYTPAKDNWPINATWNEMNAFIDKLNDITGRKFYLPDDNQWLYAARGGHKSKGFKYAGTNDINDITTDSRNASIGLTKSNELGIFYNSQYSEWVNKKAPEYPEDVRKRLEQIAPEYLKPAFYTLNVGSSWDSNGIAATETSRLSFRLAEDINNDSVTEKDDDTTTRISVSGSITTTTTYIRTCRSRCF